MALFVILLDRKAMLSFVNNEDDFIFWPNLGLEKTANLCYVIRPHLLDGLDVPKSQKDLRNMSRRI